MNYSVIDLGAVSEIIAGQSPPSSTYNDKGEGLPFYQGKADFGEWHPVTRMWCNRPVKIAMPGDVLISVRAPVGPTNLASERCCIGRGLSAIRPMVKALDSRYLIHFLRFHEVYLSGMGRGSTFSSITQNDLREILIPLPHKNGKPDLDEQKRIVAILDKADAIRRKRQQALRLTDDFLRSVFLDMFGDPGTNPKGWKTEPLGNLTLLDAPMVDPDDPSAENLLHYGPDRIEKDTGRLLPAKTAKEDGLISKKFLCDSRYLLYSKIRPYLNKVALVEEECLCSADVYPVRPVDGTVSREFLWFVLRSASFLGYAESCASRANIPKMNRSEFAAYECMRPDPNLQKSFSRIVLRALTASEIHLSANDASDDLFTSLQQRAFRGEL